MVSDSKPTEYEAIKRMEIFEFFGVLKIYEENQNKLMKKLNTDEYSNTRTRR